MTFAETVKAVRGDRGMTLEDVAINADISLSYVSDIENGRRSCPPRTAAKLAIALGQPPERFIQHVLEAQLEGLGLEIVVRKTLRGVP